MLGNTYINVQNGVIGGIRHTGSFANRRALREFLIF